MISSIGVLLLVAWAIAELLPVIASLLSAFKSSNDILLNPIGIPKRFVWANFAHAWSGPHFGMPLWRYAINSAIAVGVGVGVGMSVGTCAGYALVRSSRSVALLNRYFVVLLTAPGIVTWVPLFSLMSSFNLLSNRFGLGLVYAAFVTPLVTVLMRSYFAAFPLDLIEAAVIDGASETRAFLRIVLPTSVGVMSVVALIQAIWLWNELALAVILMIDPRSQTLPLGMLQLKGQFIDDYGYGAQYAALLLAILPIIAMFAIVQRRITDGMRLGALR
jgi:ABC-type glycerol-3-phosphate transport system permease component